jgi:hypothetical protein
MFAQNLSVIWQVYSLRGGIFIRISRRQEDIPAKNDRYANTKFALLPLSLLKGKGLGLGF